MRFMRLRVCVNHGSTFELKTTLTVFALGAKAAAEAGNNCGGIVSMIIISGERRGSKQLLRRGIVSLYWQRPRINQGNTNKSRRKNGIINEV